MTNLVIGNRLFFLCQQTIVKPTKLIQWPYISSHTSLTIYLVKTPTIWITEWRKYIILISLLMTNKMTSLQIIFPVYTSMHKIFFSDLWEEVLIRALLDIKYQLVKAVYMSTQEAFCPSNFWIVCLVHVQGGLPWEDSVLQTRNFFSRE